MAKIQPLPAAPSPPSSDDHCQGQRGKQAYTVWMKSLVFNGNGCAVYGPDGSVAFRVDNYGCRGGREVTQTPGEAFLGRSWRCSKLPELSFWKICPIPVISSPRVVVAGLHKLPSQPLSFMKGGAAVAMHGGARTCYRIDGCSGARKPEYRVRGVDGSVMAEVARKQTSAGVVLGEDVLTLTVAPEVDHLLALGLVVVRGLINRSL
ncbi:unnamed protein product [Triticum turgidum subsp. durum]|uniref:Protein LURP-one-related 11 n=1 Tax=Triticum turgidum subsp. durum TaxID=4567 RepID=A0A9R0RWW4_TRITD|nr:unnamed protein product [Triticum turgidum subsp. durum]